MSGKHILLSRWQWLQVHPLELEKRIGRLRCMQLGTVEAYHI